jgi:2-haloacid dehalogenase
MTRVIAFDVNETLLDLRALDGPFEQLLGSPSLRGAWFAQMLQLAFVGGLTGDYVDFTTAQRAPCRSSPRGPAGFSARTRSPRWSTG